MFPDLNDYDRSDFRQLILYSWKFELNAIESLINITKQDMDSKITALIELSKKNLNNPFHEVCISEVSYLYEVESLAFQSFFLTIYSVIEASLDRYCHICEKKINLKISLGDLKDKGITRAITYLEKVVEVEEIKSNSLFEKIALINRLRNDFIHRAGYIADKEKINKYEEILEIAIIDGKIKFIYEDIERLYRYMDDFLKFVFTRDLKNEFDNLSEEKLNLIKTTGEIYCKNTVTIFKLKNQKIKLGDSIIIKRNNKYIKNKIINIEFNDTPIKEASNKEVGVKFENKIKAKDIFYLLNLKNQ